MVWLDANTIAFDLTYLHTLKAKIRSLNCFDVGFRFETTLKFLSEKEFKSSDCIIIFWFNDTNLKNSLDVYSSLGTPQTKPTKSESNVKKNRRSLYVVEDIKKGIIQRFEEIHPMRHFTLEELDEFGKSNGFKMVSSGEWLTDKVPTEESWGVYVIFKKQ